MHEILRVLCYNYSTQYYQLTSTGLMSLGHLFVMLLVHQRSEI